METNHLAVIPISKISFELPTEPKEAVIEALLDLAISDLELSAEDRDELLNALLTRESAGTTGVGSVAIPHVKSPRIPQTVAALGVFRDGIDFNAVDREPVYSVFLVASPAEAATEHVNLLRWIATLARKGDYTRFIRQTKNRKEARGLLKEMGD